MPFSTIKGQERPIAMLKSAIRNGTVAHAYLFSGIPGIGKKTTALAMAKALNCETHHDDFCNRCGSCQKIERHTHPDVFSLEPEGDYIKIDQIRTMQEKSKYTPYEGKHKVVIIDHAEKMNLQASNCLLKTLEEPPPHTVLILVTPVPYQLLATVRSRCQRVLFQSLSLELLAEVLREQSTGDPDELALAASLAGGSIGRALQWMEQGALEKRTHFLSSIAHLHRGSLRSILDFAETCGEDKDALAHHVDLLKVWVRDLVIWKETGEPAYLINRDLDHEVSSIAANMSYSDLFEIAQGIHEVQMAMRFNINPRLAMETTFLTLCSETP